MLPLQRETDTPCPQLSTPRVTSLLEQLAAQSARLEEPGAWPGDQFRLLAEADVLQWVIPREYGGLEMTPVELTLGYERLAASCLITAFVLTQRNGACQRLAASENESLRQELLPSLGRGERFATVGISHLTTSRQHLRTPAVQIDEAGDDLVLQGTIPWVTGAPFASDILTGGTFPDGRQALVFLPTSARGVSIEQPPNLLAMNASQTCSVGLDKVRLPRRLLVAGPEPGVMQSGARGGTGSLTTSALAIGRAASVIAPLCDQAAQRPELAESSQALVAEWNQLYADLHSTATAGVENRSTEHSSESIRQRANSLVLRASQAGLAASKGAGFVVGHPAERAVREAMFFLVWSCPQPVLSAQLREFACLLES